MSGMLLPKSYQDLTDIRFTSRGGQTGRGEEFLSNFVGNAEGNQLVLRSRLQRAMDQGLLSYADPLPTAQPQQPEMPMYQPQPMPYFPTEMSGTAYPQFNLGYNPYMGMFSGMGNYDQFGNFNLYNQMMPQQGMFNFGLPAFGYGRNV
jgi:hypothetical protein